MRTPPRIRGGVYLLGWFQLTPEELQRCVDMMAAKELPKGVPLRFTSGGAMHHIRTIIAPQLRAQKIFALFKATTELSKN